MFAAACPRGMHPDLCELDRCDERTVHVSLCLKSFLGLSIRGLGFRASGFRVKVKGSGFSLNAGAQGPNHKYNHMILGSSHYT